MKLFKRITEVLTANINHLLDEAENPEVMVKQIIRDMETSIIKLRSETVRAIARQKQLEKQIHAAGQLAKDLEIKAKLALDKDDQDLARTVVEKKLSSESRRDHLQEELKSAVGTVAQLKSDLATLEDRVQEARRKKEDLVRRKRAADAKLRSQSSVNKAKEAMGAAAQSIFNFNDSQKNLESYEEAISQLESEAEAADEFLGSDEINEQELEKQARNEAVAKELERLKKSGKNG